MKKIWIIPTAILAANILIMIFGIATNSGVIGAYAGGAAALLTDPLIIISGIIVGISASTRNIKLYLLVFFVGTLILTTILHFVINTSWFLTDILRFNDILIIASIIFLIKNIFDK